MVQSNIGSSFESFLEDQGVLEETRTQAIKEVLALQVEEAMRVEGLTKTAMARRMGTSRAALDRFLDPRNTSITLHTLQRAAQAVGKTLVLELR